MLVLTRKIGETIRIGETITISILKFKGRAVSVGIEAPDQVRVLRGELAGSDKSAQVPAAKDGDEEAEAESTPRSGPPSREAAPGPLVSQRLSTRRVNEILAARVRARRGASRTRSAAVIAP